MNKILKYSIEQIPTLIEQDSDAPIPAYKPLLIPSSINQNYGSTIKLSGEADEFTVFLRNIFHTMFFRPLTRTK